MNNSHNIFEIIRKLMCFKFKSSKKLIHILLRKNLLKRGEEGVQSREKLIYIYY